MTTISLHHAGLFVNWEIAINGSGVNGALGGLLLGIVQIEGAGPATAIVVGRLRILLNEEAAAEALVAGHASATEAVEPSEVAVGGAERILG
jgi:hypothetical protein